MGRTDSIYARNAPRVKKILEARFEGAQYLDTRDLYKGSQAEFLDRYFAIDGFLKTPAGQWWTVQTKVRDNRYFKMRSFKGQTGPDITLEYLNNAGLPNEYPGEFFHLGAHYYLYAWESEDQKRISHWVLLNVPVYKALIEARGGLEEIGVHRQNAQFGTADFYTIPLETLDKAVQAHSGAAEWWL